MLDEKKTTTKNLTLISALTLAIIRMNQMIYIPMGTFMSAEIVYIDYSIIKDFEFDIHYFPSSITMRVILHK